MNCSTRFCHGKFYTGEVGKNEEYRNFLDSEKTNLITNKILAKAKYIQLACEVCGGYYWKHPLKKD